MAREPKPKNPKVSPTGTRRAWVVSTDERRRTETRCFPCTTPFSSRLIRQGVGGTWPLALAWCPIISIEKSTEITGGPFLDFTQGRINRVLFLLFIWEWIFTIMNIISWEKTLQKSTHNKRRIKEIYNPRLYGENICLEFL